MEAAGKTSMHFMAVNKKHIAYWLLTICGFVIAMVVIGGITRLTHSGLSIVEWAPLRGTLPPLTLEAWQELYEKYKLYPQYQKTFPNLSLEEFKLIFFWEYFHRLIARAIGFVVLIPAFFFWRKKELSPKLSKQVFFGLALGGLQGALGWFMVKSGLVDNPSVSHFRLAAHLMLALFILAYFFWLALDHLEEDQSKTKSAPVQLLKLRKIFVLVVSPILILQIIYGAFVAGLKAGYFYNTYPKMHGEWFPANALYEHPLWSNWLNNAVTIQWTHRWLAVVLLGAVVHLWRKSRTSIISDYLKMPISVLLFIASTQVILGIATLLTLNHIVLASIHQFVGCLFFTSAVWVFYRLQRVF